MDKEKAVWAGFGILGMMALVCLQRPLLSLSRDQRVNRHSRAGRTNSRQRHNTLSPISSASPTTRRLVMTVGKDDRSNGTITSKREGSVGRPASTKGTAVSRGNNEVHSPQELHVGDFTVVRELPSLSVHNNGVPDTQHTARHQAKEQQSSRKSTRGSAKKHRPMEERATQTEDYTWDELRRMEALLLGHNNGRSSEGRDTLECISPIPFRGGDEQSPLSPIALYASPIGPTKEQKLPLLPPSLQRGVETELLRLVDEVQLPGAGPHAWFSLFTFLTDLPRCVLSHHVATRGIDLPPSLPTSAPVAAVSSSSSAATQDSNSMVHFSRLQCEVRRLLKGEACQEVKIGRFRLSEDKTKVLWIPLQESKDKKTGRFSHFSVFSSDDEEIEGGDVNDDDKIKFAEIVECVLLKRRQARMISESTQFPEGNIPQAENFVELTRLTATLDETDVMVLLGKLVKLKHHGAFGTLQRNCADVSFSVDIVDLTNEAQRLLDRAAIRLVAATATRVSTVHIPSTSHELQKVSLAQKSVVQREQGNNPALRLTPPETRRIAFQDKNTTLRLSPRMSREQQSSNSTVMDCTSSREEQRKGHYSLQDRIDSIYRLCEPGENAAATPPRNTAPESFARNLTTSTIPSALSEENVRQRSLFGRSQTQVIIESHAVNSSNTSPTTGARRRFTVYDRLYTPPKGVAKVASQPSPPLSGRQKPAFNVYV